MARSKPAKKAPPSVRLADVKVVLDTPVSSVARLTWFKTIRRREAGAVVVAYHHAVMDFRFRATVATWDRMVSASRRLRAIWKAETAVVDEPSGGGRMALPPRAGA